MSNYLLLKSWMNSTRTKSSSKHQSENVSNVYFLGFNQENSCFSLGTRNGFKIFNSSPVNERFNRNLIENSNSAGIGWVELLNRSNILCLIGGGPLPIFPRNKIKIWDDHLAKFIVELEFADEVIGVKLSNKILVISLKEKVFVYDFIKLKQLASFDTIFTNIPLIDVAFYENENESENESENLEELRNKNNNNNNKTVFGNVVALIGLQIGTVHIELYGEKLDSSFTNTILINAHSNAIQAIKLSKNGKLVATASEKGTLIRVFETSSGELLRELRRGSDSCTILSISFSSDGGWLSITSDKGTLHVFSLFGGSTCDEALASRKIKTDSSSGEPKKSFFDILPKYFSSERSFAQFRLPENTKSIASFIEDTKNILVLCADGSFYKVSFIENEEPGEDCRQLVNGSIMDII